MSGKKPKRSSKNLKINTRIVLTTVLAIAIPLVLVALVCLGLLHSTSHTFQLAAETADRYSLVNQIGWNQTVSNLSDVLLRTKDTDAEKLADIAAYAAPLEKRGVALEIRRGDEVFYRSAGCKDVLGRARQIVAFDSEKNVYHFGQDGLVIVSHVQAGDQRCRLVLTGTGYTVADQTEPTARGTLSRLLMGRTGLVVLAIVLIFAAAVAAFSFFTSRTIVRPIQKIARGADAIAGGNLDYQIDYDSTNELGQTVESFNAMRLRLKETIESREKSEQLRREMIAGFAHDLRTPLTSISGNASILMGGPELLDEKKKQQLYTDIYDDAMWLISLVENLLTVTRIENGTMQLTLEPELIDEVAQEALRHLNRRSAEHTVTLAVPDDLLMAKMDPQLIVQVLINLTDNAIKYTPAGSSIAVSAQRSGETVRVEVADDGPGIPDAAKEKLFEMFYTAQAKRGDGRRGLGLGLSLCRSIVEAHGGQIGVRDNNPHGTVFWFTLPASDTPSAPPQNGPAVLQKCVFSDFA